MRCGGRVSCTLVRMTLPKDESITTTVLKLEHAPFSFQTRFGSPLTQINKQSKIMEDIRCNEFHQKKTKLFTEPTTKSFRLIK